MTQEQASHRCGLCNKLFDRRDLRDRHRRRCIHTFAKPRKSKRKSCYSCANSKLSCDLVQPSCSRCITRNIDCQYASENAASTQNHDFVASQDAKEHQDVLMYPLERPIELLQRRHTFDEVIPSQKLKAPNLNGTRQRNTELGECADSSFKTTPSHNECDILVQNPLPTNSPGVVVGFNSAGNRTTNEIEHQSSLSSSAVPEMDLSIPDPLISWNQLAIPTSSESSEMDFESNGFQIPWSDSASSAESSSQSGWIRDIFQAPMELSGLGFDLLGSLGIPGSQNLQTSTSQQALFNPVLWKPPLAFTATGEGNSRSTSASNAIPGTLGLSPGAPRASQELTNPELMPISGAQKVPMRSAEKEQLVVTPVTKLGSDDDLIKILCGYPQTMLKRGNYPPFVHHRLYRCAEGDVLEPLANAFCCVSAYNAALPSSETFVQTLMDAERDRLIKTFRPSDSSDAENLAVIHALSTYQIVGFFMSIRPNCIRSTEIQQPFFLKMTRRLIAAQGPETISEPIDLSQTSNQSDAAWRKWFVVETLRRTIFLVHIINVLSCRTEKQDPYYYEDLDNEFVLSLPVPASDVLWKASTAEEWRIACTEGLYPWEGCKLKLLCNHIENRERIKRSSNGTPTEAERFVDMSADDLEALPDFTKLLLSCIQQPT